MAVPPLASALDAPGTLAVLVAFVVVLMMVDLRLFARGREPSFREGLVWSVGWLALSLLAAIPVTVVAGEEAGVNYTTVYLIERSLSLDNLFVFILLFSYFAVPAEYRARLLFWGIAAALVMRGIAILGGVALIEEFHFVTYVLGATLLVLAYRILRGVNEDIDPDRTILVRAARRVLPVTHGFRDGRWFSREEGRLHATPLFVCFIALGAADIAFAVDSIPAAFAITRDSAVIWMGNAFALLGLRALFVLVEGLIARFRYLDETIAIVLGIVAVKLLVEDLVKIGPEVSLAIVAVAFTIGIVASMIADRGDPDSELRRAERSGRLHADGPTA
jgi:TerC family integral membrane protein